jgi:hypothetical protein
VLVRTIPWDWEGVSFLGRECRNCRRTNSVGVVMVDYSLVDFASVLVIAAQI